MKSIKQKAEERAPYTKKDSWDRIKAAINAQTSFEAGANYVLECIEELIPNDEVLQNNVRCKSAIFRIQAIIEQLKSNQ